MRVIVAAANRLEGGLIVVGVRHHDKLMHAQVSAAKLVKEGRTAEQGFVDNKGVFLTREEALIFATEAGQVGRYRTKAWPEHQLFSEDLY